MIEYLDFILNSYSVKIYKFIVTNSYFNYIDCIGLSLPLITFIFLGNRIKFLQKNIVILFYVIFFTLSIVSTFSRSKFNIANLVFYNLIPVLLIIPLHFFFKFHLVSVFWKRFLYAISLVLFIYFLISVSKISDSLNLYHYLFFAFYSH